MGILTVIQTAAKIYKVAKRIRAGSPAEKFVGKFPPHYRPYIRDVLRGADIAFSGGLIVEGLDFMMDAVPPFKQTPDKFRKTRDNVVFPSRRISRFYGRPSSRYKRRDISERGTSRFRCQLCLR